VSAAVATTVAELQARDPGNFVEITLGSAEMLADVQATLAQWATRRPFYVADDGIPLVICGRYADVRDVMLDDELFPSGLPHKRGFEKFDKFLGVQTMAQLDGEVHLRLRRLINPAFSPKAMLRLEAGIEAAVDVMLDGIEARGPAFDGMADYAGLLLDGALLTVMLRLTPEQKSIFLEMHRLIPLTTHVKAGESVPQECVDAFDRAREAIQAVVTQRRAHPGEEFISDLIAARDNDDRLSDTELFDVLFTVCVAALSGTARAMGGVLYSLFRHPDQLAEVRADPGLAPLAIEECLRFHRGGYFVFPRVATRDTQIGGTKIYEGMVVRASQQAANFDPTVYPDPLRFDIHRDPKRIMSFGVGPHQCVGNRLARLAMRVALVRLLARFPAVRLADPGFQAEYGGAIGELRIRQLPMTIR
jgi:cytochrome P450